MTTNYSESSAKADNSTYRRVRYIGIWNPPSGAPHFQILEADAAFLGADKSKKVHIDESVGGITAQVPVTDAAKMTRPIPVRDLGTDAIIEGETFTRAKLMQYLYAWAREEQLDRDDLLDPVVVEDETSNPGA